jgi:sulfite exporter TauE/SafE
MFFLAALTLGFLGSFHCVGMCGPIALTIPVKRTSQLSIFTGSLIYNAGRVVTYAVIGTLFGLLGQGFVMAGWQSFLSLTLGTLILILLIFPKIKFINQSNGFLMMLLGKIKSNISQLFGQNTKEALFFIGVLNGLLPCGLVYLGIAGSIATGNAFSGTLFMVGFGLGTIPAMMTLTAIRDFISIKFRENVRKAVPVFVGIMALLLILRGLNLGIPYVSPEAKVSPKTGVIVQQVCHKI